MKHKVLFIALCSVALTGCGLTRIVTVYPDYYTSPTTYTTSVTMPRTRTTTTTRVVAASEDICLSLDLQAVAAAFAQSSTVQEFENLLNDSSFMLSNLDLNGDGYVDYLRVIETVEGHNHVFLIQAVIGDNIYQDVASVVAEMSSATTAYVQVIGAPYVYGLNYIIRPVFLVTPRIYAHLWHPAYRPWHSPWYWGHYPSCYRRPAPMRIGHYQAYVRTYMTNHRYCREVYYDNSCHYTNYNIINVNVQRNDYAVQHPERTFTERTAKINTVAGTSSSSVMKNARDVTAAHASAATVETTSSRTASRNSGASRSEAATSRTATTVSPATPATTSSRTATSVTPATTSSRTATSVTPATTSSRTATSVTPATTSSRTATSATPASSTGRTTSGVSKPATGSTTTVTTRTTSSSRVRSTGKVSTTSRQSSSTPTATVSRTSTSAAPAKSAGKATSTSRSTISRTR